MPRFAANLTMMFTEWPFLERFQAAAENNFPAVEYLFPYAHRPEQVRAALVGAGLQQALFNAPPGEWDAGERGIACHAERRAEFEAGIRQALIYAQATNLRRLHVMSGLGSRESPAQRAAYEDSLRLACDLAGAAGLDILIEPINARNMPGYFLNDFAYAAALIETLARPNLKLQFDIYHRQILHGDVLTGLQTLLPITGHVQIAAVPRRHEPGTGELDDAAILHALDALGYDGFVGCEYNPESSTLPGLTWRQKLGFPGAPT